MKWITRKDIKVDRVACPWLIRRFVDPQAEFLFVEEKDLVEQARKQDAIPFDAPKIETIKLNHRGPPVYVRSDYRRLFNLRRCCTTFSAHRPRSGPQAPGGRGPTG